ncbi:hypothetical protein TWF694_001351 [Orbilia ellipsospora]|uniref:Uncharacterized protein n=1 Tax=Orbilia ellipsospora TaxID=2528407 RepID=A0AAV9XRK4_9PEZI
MADSKIEYSAVPRDSIDDDLEALPDYSSHDNLLPSPPPLREKRCRCPNRRRRLAIAGLVALFVPTVLLSLPSFGIHPLQCMTLPASRPAEMSMCDYYATKNSYWNSAGSQKALVRSIVDKAFLGAKNPEGYFGYKTGQYNGILRHGDYFGADIDLTKYFDGSANTTNVHGHGSAVNFFNGRTFKEYGREYPAGTCQFHKMKEGMYRYIAPMLGCSVYGNTVQRYSGRSMKEVHRFMDFSNNWDWMYFIHQIQMGAIAAKFSQADAMMLELYLVDKFGPKIDVENKKVVLPFDNPELEASKLPPKLDPKDLESRAKEIADIMIPKYTWKREPEALDQEASPVEIVADKVKRQTENFSSTPPPLTTPLNAPQPTQSYASSTVQPTSQSVPSNILPIALGAGIGAALGIIIIGIVIAYLVIRKKRISKRKSTPSLGIQNGIHMQKKDSVNRRVDRSESGKVVGKPKDYAEPKKEEGEITDEKVVKGHRKNESVGVRSVRFSEVDLN